MPKAARKTDICLHGNLVITASPDVTTEYLKQARLNDMVDPCKAPPHSVGGTIVSSSKTVFVNGVGAARVTDKVKCIPIPKNPAEGVKVAAELVIKAAKLAMVGASPRSGASQYKPRNPEDQYHKMMEVEHEASEWDEVEIYEREKLDGKRGKTEIPVGVPPGTAPKGGGKKGRPKRKKQAKAKPFRRDDDDPNPLRPKGKKKKKKAKRKSSKKMKGGSTTSVPKIGKGSSFGGGGKGSGESSDYEDEEERDDSVELELEFPIDIKFGRRKGKKGSGSAANKIVKGAFTVWIGD